MQRLNILAAALLIGAATAGAHAQTTLGFIDDQPVRNDLQGTLPGMVKFAQSHTIDPRGNSAREQPMLVTERETMVMFFPATTIPTANWTQLRMDVYDRGMLLGELVLAPPEVFPLSDRPQRDARPDVLYSKKAWTTRLPWKWVKPGMSLRFRYQGKIGNLVESHIDFSGASELVLQNIRVGMLTDAPPVKDNWMETNTAQAALDYFQKIPVSRLTVGQYLPVTLDRVVLANGTVYTTASKGNGGVYEGDMREGIAKDLISHGINFANFGIPDSIVHPEQPNHFRQVTAHQAIGRYANGLHHHGLSGGSGIATLYELQGNEFSHELGHNFGLGHNPGGGKWTSHHATSGWGYDAFRHRMNANLEWSVPASDNVIEGYRTPAYKGLYAFNTDPMELGEPDSAFSRYSLHTGYSAKRTQHYFEQSAVVDASSPSGYRLWNPVTRTMAPDMTKKRPVAFGVPVVTLVGFYDPRGVLPTTIYPGLHGNHGHVYALPTGTATGCKLDVSYATGAPTSIALSSTRHTPDQMNKLHVNLRATPRPTQAAVSCVVGGVRKELHRIAIAAPSQALPAPVKVGREDTFLSAAMRLPTIPGALGRKPFPTVAELEARIVDLYGDISNRSSTGRGRPGSIYRYDNPQSQRREYFMLRTYNYGAFPTNATTNAQWRYMGHAEAHLNFAPEPFRALRTQGATTNHKIAAYYGVAGIKTWRSPDATARVGDVYVYNNPHAKKLEYFRLNRTTYGAFPTNGRSGGAWTYLGDQATMNTAFAKPTEYQFRQYVANWYRQSAVLGWSDTITGNVGDIYRMAHAGRVDYFALRTQRYWYFPGDKTNNIYWTYLGSFQ